MTDEVVSTPDDTLVVIIYRVGAENPITYLTMADKAHEFQKAWGIYREVGRPNARTGEMGIIDENGLFSSMAFDFEHIACVAITNRAPARQNVTGSFEALKR